MLLSLNELLPLAAVIALFVALFRSVLFFLLFLLAEGDDDYLYYFWIVTFKPLTDHTRY
uniref:Uncharacterized protein n=1 Tax=Arundo donax TaxID=35708 RepID=A0A0A8Y0N4_ARUDO